MRSCTWGSAPSPRALGACPHYLTCSSQQPRENNILTLISRSDNSSGELTLKGGFAEGHRAKKGWPHGFNPASSTTLRCLLGKGRGWERTGTSPDTVCFCGWFPLMPTKRAVCPQAHVQAIVSLG